MDLDHCSVTSVYKPPGTPFRFSPPSNFDDQQRVKIVIGDFNSHNPLWGYNDLDDCGQAVETWAESNNLTLVHDPKQPASFNSGRWKRRYNPDLIFTSSDISSQCVKTVCPPIPRTQHRPIMCEISPVVRPLQVPLKRRFNYSKANWEQYAKSVDDALLNVPPSPREYDRFADIVSEVSRHCIPRGCRTSYIPGLSKESGELLMRYETLYCGDPFSEETTRVGEELLSRIDESRRDRWIDTVTNINMTHNSKRAWKTRAW